MSINQKISNNRSFLMGMAMLSIMLFHQGWIWGWNPIFAFFHFYGNWGVDIFLFVSGFGLYYSLNNDGRVIPFYKRRLIRILPLCLLCGLFRYIVDHILPVGVGGYPTGVHKVTSDWMTILSWDKWFVPLILAYYLLMPVVFVETKRIGLKVMIFAYFIAILYEFSFFPGWMALFDPTRFPSFCIGVITAAGCIHFDKIWQVLGSIAVIFAVIYKFPIMMGWSSMPNSVTYLILSFGIVQLSIFLISIFSNPYLDRIGRDNKAILVIKDCICFIGRHSLEIYLVHEFVYRYTYRFLIDTPIPVFLQMLIGMGGAIIIALVLSRISDSIVKTVIVK